MPALDVVVKVTLSPAQIVLSASLLESVAVGPEVTDIVMTLPVAGLPVAHAALEVITQLTVLVLANVLLV